MTAFSVAWSAPGDPYACRIPGPGMVVSQRPRNFPPWSRDRGPPDIRSPGPKRVLRTLHAKVRGGLRTQRRTSTRRTRGRLRRNRTSFKMHDHRKNPPECKLLYFWMRSVPRGKEVVLRRATEEVVSKLPNFPTGKNLIEIDSPSLTSCRGVDPV